ncbi:MAG: hypothetical protein M1826_002088, partial [Phylliscum demangeonii]
AAEAAAAEAAAAAAETSQQQDAGHWGDQDNRSTAPQSMALVRINHQHSPNHDSRRSSRHSAGDRSPRGRDGHSRRGGDGVQSPRRSAGVRSPPTSPVAESVREEGSPGGGNWGGW